MDAGLVEEALMLRMMMACARCLVPRFLKEHVKKASTLVLVKIFFYFS